VRNNIAFAFRISWPWYAVFVPIVVVLSLWLDRATGGNPEANAMLTLLVNLVITLITLLAFAAVAVNWHRYILLDEVPRGREIFRLDEKTWRYFGNLLLISLAALAAGLVIGLPIGFLGAMLGAVDAFVILIVIILVPVIGVLAMRMGVKLPAVALGRSDFRMHDAWSVTNGNNVPVLLIFLFELFVALGAGLALGAVALAANTIHGMLGIAVGFTLQLVMNWVFTIFSMTVLTSLYGFFVEGRDF
jgi:hypothetical protein